LEQEEASMTLDEFSEAQEEDPFVEIIAGKQPGKIIHKDDDKKFALIENIHPEAAVHWLAIPYEDGYNTESLQHQNQERFLDLINFAIAATKAQIDEHPILQNGFSIKFHCGAFETIPHAKLHILSTE
jgi:diadenosine tetraphosphate (Ap4A) HIT family hydrolase